MERLTVKRLIEELQNFNPNDFVEVSADGIIDIPYFVAWDDERGVVQIY